VGWLKWKLTGNFQLSSRQAPDKPVKGHAETRRRGVFTRIRRMGIAVSGWPVLARFGQGWQPPGQCWPASASVWPVSGQLVNDCYSECCDFWPVSTAQKTRSDFQREGFVLKHSMCRLSEFAFEPRQGSPSRGASQGKRDSILRMSMISGPRHKASRPVKYAVHAHYFSAGKSISILAGRPPAFAQFLGR
jgi:hypothetical protein